MAPKDSGAERTPRTPSKSTTAKAKSSPAPSPDKRTPKKDSGSPDKRAKKATSYSSSDRTLNTLSADSLAKLDALNAKTDSNAKRKSQEVNIETKEKDVGGRIVKERSKHKRKKEDGGEKKRRFVSGVVLEEGWGHRGGLVDADERRSKRGYWILGGLAVLLLVILVPIGVVVIGKKGSSSGSSQAPAGAAPSNGNLNGVSEADIPTAAKGSYLDPFTWYDTKDFNCTYTNDTVGGLPVMGLNWTWDDSVKANEYVPALNGTWAYGTMPIRGVNLGGWLSIEPFVTPSLFNSYASSLGIVDEYTLTQHLGPSDSAKLLEKHYSTFITESSFAEIQAAGLDHVRIPYPYWAITTYPGDPYVPKICWRYLLRGIEYARKYGLRVKLDLHAVPGSQNGWNHSGRQGSIGWLNGTDGALNGQRSLDLHNQLSTFFAQPRYAHIVTIYGLVNEPKMTLLPAADVVEWTTSAIAIVRKNGISQAIAFGDGFLGLPNWKGKLQGIDNLVMDAHQYVIFNTVQIAFPHQQKIQFACSGWSAQMSQSVDTATGFGPTMCGEWSQADTDCAPYLNNVNVGARWTGNMNTGDPKTQVLSPTCPPNSGTCECDDANADPSKYSDVYKKWLLMNAEAQMESFEIGWGWFYWTWITESAVQWSWKLGVEAGILPTKTWIRDFNCTGGTVPAFEGLPENY